MFLIKSDDQRQKTLKHIEGLKAQVERIRQKHGSERARHFSTAASRKIQEFEEQVKDYDRLKQEGPGAFRPQESPRHAHGLSVRPFRPLKVIGP